MQYEIHSWKMTVSARLYLDMWLTEQIPISDWLKILDTRPDVEKLYAKHIQEHQSKN